MVPGASKSVSSSATPSCSAVASVTILNVEPGAKSAWVARLMRVPESSEPLVSSRLSTSAAS